MENIQRKIEYGREIFREITDVIRGFYKTPERELKIRTTRNSDNTYNHEITLDGMDISNIISQGNWSKVESYKEINRRRLSLDPNLERAAIIYISPPQSRWRFRK